MEEKSYLSLRLPKALKEQLELQAQAQNRSVSKQAIRYIEFGLIADNLHEVSNDDTNGNDDQTS